MEEVGFPFVFQKINKEIREISHMLPLTLRKIPSAHPDNATSLPMNYLKGSKERKETRARETGGREIKRSVDGNVAI